MVTGLRLFFTNDTSINDNSKWEKLSQIRASDPVAGLTVSENEVFSHGQHYMRLTFNLVVATGVRLELFRTNAGNGNVVLTELMVLGYRVQCS
eukprot:COSAG05_NODE_1405_length_4969_cov_12.779466_2_plen_93_part_00